MGEGKRENIQNDQNIAKRSKQIQTPINLQTFNLETLIIQYIRKIAFRISIGVFRTLQNAEAFFKRFANAQQTLCKFTPPIPLNDDFIWKCPIFPDEFQFNSNN